MWHRDIERWYEEAKLDGNPYLAEWLALAALQESRHRLFSQDINAWRDAVSKSYDDGTSEYEARRHLVGKYAWAVPCNAALDALEMCAPIVEMGAGTGYWAWLLRNRGVDVMAFDRLPLPNSANKWHVENECWTSVLPGEPSVLSAHSDRALFLCWSPYDDPMAAECLQHYAGKIVVFVGEHRGGCTANDDFFDALERGYEQRESVDLPTFEGLRDYLSVWERK